MLSLKLLFTSLLLSFAAAQNNTLDPNTVDPTLRSQWCQSELNSCPLLCGGQANLKTQQCSGSNILGYTCTCSNGSAPADIDQYVNTIPNFVCNQLFADCRQQTPGSDACKTCGTLQPSDVKAIAASTSAASSSSTGSTTATATSSSATTTASGKSSAGRVEEAMGAVAAGVVAALVL